MNSAKQLVDLRRQLAANKKHRLRKDPTKITQVAFRQGLVHLEQTPSPARNFQNQKLVLKPAPPDTRPKEKRMISSSDDRASRQHNKENQTPIAPPKKDKMKNMKDF